MAISAQVDKAYKAALKARHHAHSPYSRFKVGAALQVAGETEAVGGCNIENASFGGTVCAERVAVFQAIARLGSIQPEFLVVVTNEEKATVPCALCLQVLAEFCSDDMPIYLGNEKSIQKEYRLKDLLPHAFRSFEVKS
jgi:homotetrameric cytidine deaminase